MKILDKSAKMSVDKMRQELNKRKNTTKKLVESQQIES